MKKKEKYIKRNKGITGIDIVVAIVVITIFIGLLTNLTVGLYKNSLEIRKSSDAMSYAVMICEKVDQKTFEEALDTNFVNNLKNAGEITIPDEYEISYSVEDIPEIKEEAREYMKKIKVRVKYIVSGKSKSIFINKLKVKELYNENG